MRRLTIEPRPQWQAAVTELGLLWHSDAGGPYWDESAAYAFSMAQVEAIENATEAVHRLYVEAAETIVRDDLLMASCGIPQAWHKPVREAWQRQSLALDFGRFDFAWDGTGEPKLLEYNCDTPTSLLETSIIQWFWKEDVFPEADQFNSLHEKLLGRWQAISGALPGRRVWFAHIADDAHEDTMTTTYLRDLAGQAGLETYGLLIDQIGVDAQGYVLDQDDYRISALFKLYPWEWMAVEDFADAILPRLHEVVWLEPVWKMLWSNKAVLAVLWDLFPDHPNLLRTSLNPNAMTLDCVAKPVLAREGANIAVVSRGQVIAQSEGNYDTSRMVFQERYPLKDFGNGFPVLGSWIVAGEAAGLGIREDGLITGNSARFVPHIIDN